MKIRPKNGYDTAQKRIYRATVWSALSEGLTEDQKKTAKVLFIIGPDDALEVPEIRRQGFTGPLTGVDSSPYIREDELRAKYPQVIVNNCRIEDLQGYPSGFFDVANFDICAGLSKPAREMYSQAVELVKRGGRFGITWDGTRSLVKISRRSSSDCARWLIKGDGGRSFSKYTLIWQGFYSPGGSQGAKMNFAIFQKNF